MSQWLDLKVLIVDDEPIMRDALRFEVEILGCTVAEASSGTDAKRLLEKTSFDLIISDIRMPDGDGVDLLNHVRNQRCEPLMFLMSGFADIDTWEAYHLGAEAYIGKPFDVEHLESYLVQAQRARTMSWDQPLLTTGEAEITIMSTEAFALGRGGFFLEKTGLNLRKNQIVRFTIETGSDDLTRLVGTGQVQWVRTTETNDLKPGCGIEFLTLNPSSFAWVQQILQNQKLKAYIPRNCLST